MTRDGGRKVEVVAEGLVASGTDADGVICLWEEELAGLSAGVVDREALAEEGCDEEVRPLLASSVDGRRCRSKA